MRLDEVMSSIVPYEWASAERATFDIGEFHYRVAFLWDRDDDRAEVIFVMRREMPFASITSAQMTGTRNEFVVLSTVIAIIKEFVNRNNIKTLRFSAKEPSRINVYLSLAKKMATGYDIEHFHNGSEENFILTKK